MPRVAEDDLELEDKEQIREEVEMLLRELRVDYVDVLIADCPPEWGS